MLAATWPTGWWENAADAMAWTPTAQLARAVTQAGTSPGAATAHLLAGLAVLPVLFVLHGRTFRLFLVATPGVGAASKRARRQRRPYPRWLPESPAWTVAVRSVRLKLREPRLLTGLVAALALAIGGSLAVVLSSGDGRNPTMVLLGTAAQFAVLLALVLLAALTLLDELSTPDEAMLDSPQFTQPVAVRKVAAKAVEPLERLAPLVDNVPVRTVVAAQASGAHYQDKSVDYEALSVAKNAPRWIKMLTKHGFMPRPVAA